MISKSALDIAALLRSMRGKAAKPSAPSLDAYYRKVLSTADPQYAKRLGVLLNDKLTSVTKTAELDSSVALPASAALLGASAVAGGVPLAKYVATVAPHAGKGMNILRQEAVAKLRAMALMQMLKRSPAILNFKKTAEELSPAEAVLLASGTGLGTGALLAAGVKARKGNRVLSRAGKLTGLALGLPLLYYPAKRILKNVDKDLPSDLAWMLSKMTEPVRNAAKERARRNAVTKLTDSSIDTTGVYKSASEDIAPYVAAGTAGTGGFALGALGAAKAMEKRLPKDVFDYVVSEYFRGNGRTIPKVIKHTAPILGAVSLGLAGRSMYKNSKPFLSAILHEIRRRRGLV